MVDYTQDDMNRAIGVFGLTHGDDLKHVAQAFADARREATSELEQRVRDLIERLENQPYVKATTSQQHWMDCGMDEAYDNVLDWLYRDVLLEER